MAIIFILFLTFISFYAFPVKVHKNNIIRNLIHSYIVSLLLFFYVIFTAFVFLKIKFDFGLSIKFDLVSLVFLSYVLKVLITYSLYNETRSFAFVLMFSVGALVISIFYFNIVYFIPFLIIFDFLLRKTYKYYKTDNKKSTLQYCTLFL